jgi:hypothetical protein
MDDKSRKVDKAGKLSVKSGVGEKKKKSGRSEGGRFIYLS